jgi:hypothetical protein
VRAGRMIDAVTATTGGTAFQRTELCGQSGMVQELDTPLLMSGSSVR